VNDDPYGNGWLIRIRMPTVAGRRPLRRRGVQEGSSPSSEAPVWPHRRDRDAMIATVGVSSIDEIFRDIPAGFRLEREIDLEPALSAGDRSANLGEIEKERHTDEGAVVPGAGYYDQYVPAASTRVSSAASSSGVHAYSGDEPGRAAGDIRVPEAICELTA